MLTGVPKPAALRHAEVALASSIALVTNLVLIGAAAWLHIGAAAWLHIGAAAWLHIGAAAWLHIGAAAWLRRLGTLPPERRRAR